MRYVACTLALRRKPGQHSVTELPDLLHREGVYESPQELVLVVPYDAQGNIAKVVEVARGDHTQVNVSIPLLIGAVLTAGVSRFWLIHNHPSGNLTPTALDMGLTEKVQLAAAIVGVTLEDHIIVGPPNGWFSFEGHGLLKVDEATGNLIASARAGQQVLHTENR